VQATYASQSSADAEVQRKAALRLQETLSATGKVRGPKVAFRDGVVAIKFVAKADGLAGALYAASVIVDAAAQEAGGELLGELLQQSVVSLPLTV
jgi:hypothetical protein